MSDFVKQYMKACEDAGLFEPAFHYSDLGRILMSTKTGVMFYANVAAPSASLEGPIYVRASQRFEGRVYLKLPAAVGVGVYLSAAEASLLAKQLQRALHEAEKPLPAQKLEIEFADGTLGYVPLSKNTKRAVKSRVVTA